jgi:hypothetical protein
MPINERKLADGTIRYEVRRRGKEKPNCMRFWTLKEAKLKDREWSKDRDKHAALAKMTKEEKARELVKFKRIQNGFLYRE